MKLGALDISTVKLGTNQVQAVYQGANLVWQNAPVATAATGVGQTSFTANWNAYTGAVVYLLDVSESSDFSTFVYEDQQVNAPTTSYVVIGLNPNTTYYYRVRASTEALTDADYQAVLDYATTQGYTLPSASQQLLQNQLVVDLKDGGIWSKLDTFAVFATDGDSDFALIDWKRVTDYTAVNSPTFTTNEGFEGNGTSAYIDTNYNPSTSGVNYTLNDACFGGVKNINISNTAYFLGCSINARNSLRGSGSGANRINQSTIIFSPSADFSSYNFVALHRDSSTTGAFSYDNTIVTSAANSTIIENSNQFVLRSGTTYANFGARMYFSGANLISENTDFYNAWNTYYTSL
jgi:hypothetical protein